MDGPRRALSGAPSAPSAHPTAHPPTVWLLRISYCEVAVEDTSMQSDKVLYMDHFSVIMIWSGDATTGAEFDAIRETGQPSAPAPALAILLRVHSFIPLPPSPQP